MIACVRPDETAESLSVTFRSIDCHAPISSPLSKKAHNYCSGWMGVITGTRFILVYRITAKETIQILCVLHSSYGWRPEKSWRTWLIQSAWLEKAYNTDIKQAVMRLMNNRHIITFFLF
jgi:hypothetical protein